MSTLLVPELYVMRHQLQTCVTSTDVDLKSVHTFEDSNVNDEELNLDMGLQFDRGLDLLLNPLNGRDVACAYTWPSRSITYIFNF